MKKTRFQRFSLRCIRYVTLIMAVLFCKYAKINCSMQFFTSQNSPLIYKFISYFPYSENTPRNIAPDILPRYSSIHRCDHPDGI